MEDWAWRNALKQQAVIYGQPWQSCYYEEAQASIATVSIKETLIKGFS